MERTTMASSTASIPHLGQTATKSWSASDSARGLTSVQIRAAGPERDLAVCENWMSTRRAVGMGPSDFVPDHERETLDFIRRAREHLGYGTLVAEKEGGEAVGSASCQVWAGPQPDAVNKLGVAKIGTLWAVHVKPEHRRRGIAARLVGRCVDRLREAGCSRAVLLHASEDGRRVYERLGFGPGPMLALDLSDNGDGTVDCECEEVFRTETAQYKITEEKGGSLDLILADHYRRCMLQSGWEPNRLHPEIITNTMEFIEDARQRLGFRSFVAYGENGEIMASVCCQVWEGPFPSVLKDSVLKFGSVWGLFLKPEIKCRSVGAASVERCVDYLGSIGCLKAITLCPNAQTEAVFREGCSFHASNAMVLELKRPAQVPERVQGGALAEGATRHMVDQLRACPEVSRMSDRQLGWLVTANHNQLQALDFGEDVKAVVIRLQKEGGTFVDPEDNWFTQNVTKLGRGFDLWELSKNPDLLAAKFDRLALKYNEWTLGNHSRVESWIVGMASRLENLPSTTHILDICCGMGLMGHLLRVCGFEGLLSGFDVSPRMLDVARCRNCYDYLRTVNANKNFTLPNCAADIVLCSGAMELLETGSVIGEFSCLLKKGGELWMSFQAAAGENSPAPTSHQNVKGIARDEMERILRGAGFGIVETELSLDAFWTPSPSLDGTLIPVPYFFVCCRRL